MQLILVPGWCSNYSQGAQPQTDILRGTFKNVEIKHVHLLLLFQSDVLYMYYIECLTIQPTLMSIYGPFKI